MTPPRLRCFRFVRPLAVLGLVGSGLGCGPSVDSEDDGAETDGNGETSTTSAETDGEDGSSGTATNPTTDGAACELPESDPPGDVQVTITIRNDADAPRYLSPRSSFSCDYAPLEILVEGEPVHWNFERTYPYRCTRCFTGCSDGGATGLLLNPGATAEVAWDGGIWTSVPLSSACALEACEDDGSWNPANGLPSTCEVLRFPDPLEYTALVNVFDECPLGATPCDCPGDVCDPFFYEPKRGDYTVEASASLPSGVEIVLQ